MEGRVCFSLGFPETKDLGTGNISSRWSMEAKVSDGRERGSQGREGKPARRCVTEVASVDNSKGKLAVWGFLIDSIYIQNHVYIILEEIFQRQF